MSDDTIKQFIKNYNLDGLQRLHLLFIAERLYEDIKGSGIDIPKLNRSAKRDMKNLTKWFYDNRSILSSWLKTLHCLTQMPERVTREKTSQKRD